MYLDLSEEPLFSLTAFPSRREKAASFSYLRLSDICNVTSFFTNGKLRILLSTYQMLQGKSAYVIFRYLFFQATQIAKFRFSYN